MASVENVVLTITERGDVASVEVSYRIFGDVRDVATRQPYRETVDLSGDDEEAGEDGRSEGIPSGRIFKGEVTFTSTQPVLRTRTKTLPVNFLNEDRASFFSTQGEEDEIRARVVLAPVSPKSAAAISDLVRLG